MKKTIISVYAILMFFMFAGCAAPLQEDVFSYQNGFRDEVNEYFDSYALVYQNDDYDLSLYAVKSSKILDAENHEFINYILRWNIDKLNNISLTSGSHSFYSGSISWAGGGYSTHLIPGQEISDYCQEDDLFTLTIDGVEVDNIAIYRNDNQVELNWQQVSALDTSNFQVYLLNNFGFIVTIVSIVLLSGVFLVVYLILYRKNYNNFVTEKRVRRLPKYSMVFAITISLALLAMVIITTNYDKPTNRYDNNFFDYEYQEASVNYRPEFINNGYDLIGSSGLLEIYTDANGNDEITFLVVLFDGQNRYLIDQMMFSFPNSAVNDSYRVDLHQKELEDDGYVFAYLVEAIKNIEGQDVVDYSFSLGVYENIGGVKTFIDFMDSTNSYEVYYKNSKGYYRILYNLNVVLT